MTSILAVVRRMPLAGGLCDVFSLSDWGDAVLTNHTSVSGRQVFMCRLKGGVHLITGLRWCLSGFPLKRPVSQAYSETAVL